MGVREGDIPTWVVSLPRSVERRGGLEARLEPLGIRPNWFDGVDGHTFSADKVAALNADRHKLFARGLTAGELGCYLSHHNLFKQLARSSQEASLVLEDDAELDADVADVVDAIVKMGRFDLVSLDGGPKRRRYIDERSLPGGYKRVRSFESKSGAVAYVVSREGAAKLARYCTTIVHPIDVTIKRYWEYGGRLFNVVPTIARELPGSISTVNANGDRRPTDKTARGQLYHLGAEVAKATSFAGTWVQGALLASS